MKKSPMMWGSKRTYDCTSTQRTELDIAHETVGESVTNKRSYASPNLDFGFGFPVSVSRKHRD